MLRCLVLGSRVSCLRTAWGVGRKPKEVSGSCQKHAGMAKCYLRQGYGVFMTRVSGGRCPRSTPEPPRSLAVVPLIGDKRYYGEAPVGLAGGLREGLVRGRRNWGPEVRLSKSEFRRPKPERRPNTEGRSHDWAFRLSGFGLLSALGFRASGLDLCAHGLALLSRNARARGQVGQGTPNAVFGPMTILLICWAGISSVFCLAFLSVAARPVPCMDAQMTPGSETASTQDIAVVLENVKTASLSAEGALPSPCQTA